jgi:hypothetical protein
MTCLVQGTRNFVAISVKLFSVKLIHNPENVLMIIKRNLFSVAFSFKYIHPSNLNMIRNSMK